MPSPMDAAFFYARHGIPVFPCNGKVPLVPNGLYAATTDLQLIEQWQKQFPNANIAIPTGEVSGLLVIDIDPRHGGLESLAALERKYGPLPVTRKAQTPSGGFHLFFKYPPCVDIRNSAGKLGPGMDVRGNGGYVVAAPSINPETLKAYIWLVKIEPNPPSPWLVELLVAPVAASEPRPEGPIPAGRRNDTLTRIAGAMRRQGCSQEVIEAALFEANLKQCNPPLPDREVRQIAHSVSRYPPAEPPAEHERAEERQEPPKPNGRVPHVETPSPEAEPEEVTPAPLRRWPEPLAPEAFHGIAGEITHFIDPHTEGDPAGVLLQLLGGLGTLFGHKPYYSISGGRHYTNTYHCLVGQTASGRKGSGLDCVQYVLKRAYPDWAKDHITGGLSSGEGLTWAVRDPVWKRVRQKDGSYEEEEVDSGVSDKRLLLLEPEFASIFSVMARQGNNLSPAIKQGWDSGNLNSGNLVKNNPSRATAAHITLIGHISRYELLRVLNENEFASGFINRFLWCCVRRSKSLPSGGYLQHTDLSGLISKIKAAVEFAQSVDEMRRSEDAEKLWASIYDDRLNSVHYGSLGEATGRAAAQTLRVSMIEALSDQSAIIQIEHLRAALAVWEYTLGSARFIFGDDLGYPLAEQIRKALQETPGGLTRSQISRELLQRNKKPGEVNAALLFLEELSLARRVMEQTEGRPRERWFAV